MPTINLPPWAQTALAALVLALILLHQVGRALLRRDPKSAWGLRLVILGVGLQALRRHPAARLLPPRARLVLDSLTESDPPPPRKSRRDDDDDDGGWGPPGAMLAAVLCAAVLVGCSNLGPAKLASNALGDALEEAAPLIEEQCLSLTDKSTLPADPAEAQREAQRRMLEYERASCGRIVTTYGDGRRAHELVHATLGAIVAGECAGKSRLAGDCNLLAATMAASKATAAVIERTRQLRGPK